MQDIITPTSYQTTAPETPQKHRVLIVVVAVFLILVAAVVLIGRYGRTVRPTDTRDSFTRLEQVSTPVTLTPQEQAVRMESLQKVQPATVVPVSKRADMLNQLQ
jgi:hypothetical protein